MTKSPKSNPLHGAGGAGGVEYADLIRAVQKGSRPALERLLMRAQDVAYRFSLTVCGHPDDAEDAMQEALLKTYRYAARIKEPRAFRTWLYRTVKNACLINRRKRVDEPARLVSLDELVPMADGSAQTVEVADSARTPEQVTVNRRLRRALKEAIGGLPKDYRLIVFLREIEGLSTKEVADVTGISEANVKTRLHRARLFLRQRLEHL